MDYAITSGLRADHSLKANACIRVVPYTGKQDAIVWRASLLMIV